MSKRKQDKEYKHLLSKIKKLERKVSRKRIISSSSEDEESVHTSSCNSSARGMTNSVLAALGPQDWLTTHDTVEFEYNGNVTPEPGSDEVMEPDPDAVPEETPEVVPETTPEVVPEIVPEATPAVPEQIQEANIAVEHNLSSTSSAAAGNQDERVTFSLESDVLEILGEDPSAAKKYAPGVHIEIATRFQHIATNGLSKEMRKELMAKYITPENCCHIAAPGLNPEIKAALPENFVKRDKGIETKQSQLASAISCLSEVLSSQLNSKTKNNEMLAKLMDMGRLLCDIQHGDSITRRNFIFFNLKKEMKEHLTNTKIDTYLFSESLSETLKSAKAVSKSGTELKPGQKKAPKTATQKPLNRRAPAPARRPPGPPPRSREPAATRAPPPPPPPYSRMSSHHHPPPNRSWRR